MFTFTESVRIAAPRQAVWNVMRDVRDWWPASNREHDSVDVLTEDGEIGLGKRLRIRERVAGIPCDATGEITRFESGRTVAWEAPAARYRLACLRVTVSEGVTRGSAHMCGRCSRRAGMASCSSGVFAARMA
jgi:hypothetical protein